MAAATAAGSVASSVCVSMSWPRVRQFFEVQVGGDDAGALGGVGERGGAADALGGGGDEGGFAGEAGHGVKSLRLAAGPPSPRPSPASGRGSRKVGVGISGCGGFRRGLRRC